MTTRRRLDRELVRRAIFPTEEVAVQAIDAGDVLVGGWPTRNPARRVAAHEAVTLAPAPPRVVGRGAHKLEAALDRFEVDVAGRRVLDAGASTGGFTDAVLQRHATHVVAIDVGHNQLHERLRADDRVTSLERTDIRTHSDRLGADFDLVVADLAFISLRSVAPHLVERCATHGELVVLVKPQFEVARAEASRTRGVIREPAQWRAALTSVLAAFAGAGTAMMGVMASLHRGADGNVEFFLHLVPAAPHIAPPTAGLLDAAVAAADETVPGTRDADRADPR